MKNFQESAVQNVSGKDFCAGGAQNASNLTPGQQKNEDGFANEGFDKGNIL